MSWNASSKSSGDDDPIYAPDAERGPFGVIAKLGLLKMSSKLNLTVDYNGPFSFLACEVREFPVKAALRRSAYEIFQNFKFPQIPPNVGLITKHWHESI